MDRQLADSDTAGRDDEGLSAHEIVGALRKNWLLTLGVMVLVALGATFYALGQTKIYAATTTLQIDPMPPRPLGNDVQGVVDIGAGTFWANKEYYETQYKIIASRRVAVKTVQQLGLHRDATFVEPIAKSGEDVSVEDAAELLRDRLTVDPGKDSRLVSISYQDSDPARAQRVVSALVDAYIQQNLDDALSSNQSSGDWLRGQKGKLKTELESSELDLHKYKKKKNILSMSLDDQSNMLREEMTQINKALTDVRTKQQHVAARRNELAKVSADAPSDLPAKELLESELLRQFRREYVEANREVEGLRKSGKGSSHPETKAAEAKAGVTLRALQAEVRNIQKSLDRDLAATRREAAGLSRLAEAAKKRALSLNLMEIEYKRLERTKGNTEKLYSLVLERSKESELAGMMHFNNIRVVDSALVPSKPVRPNVPLSSGVGLLIGLGLGMVAAVGRELLDRTVKTPSDVERALQTSVMGMLPRVASLHASYGKRSSARAARRAAKLVDDGDSPPELVTHAFPKSAVAEAARAIRTNISFMSPDKPFTRILVTSAAPSEGKTTVACCLATVMAQSGQRVLLLDCDLRRPRLHKIFRRTNDIGVTSALLDRSVLRDADLSTVVENLSVLPAGPHVPNPAEIVQSANFSRMLDELQQQFDFLILDSPPLMPVTDPAILSSKVDGVLVVVRAYQTRKDVARHALRSLQAVGGRLIGAVLNAVDVGKPGYGQGYGYYYQYYDSPENQTAEAAE